MDILVEGLRLTDDSNAVSYSVFFGVLSPGVSGIESRAQPFIKTIATKMI